MSFLGWGKRNSEEAKVNKLIKSALKSNYKSLVGIYTEIGEYIPRYSRLVITQTVKQIADILLSTSAPLELQSKVLDLLVSMVDQIDESDPETDALKPMLADKSIIPALFHHTRNIDTRVIHLLHVMLLREPMKFIEFILSSGDSMKPLIQAAALSQDEEAGHLLHCLALSNPAVSRLLLPDLKPQLRKYPATIAIDFMVSSAQLLAMIPREDIESWILQHNKFTIFDVDQLCNVLYPFLWNRPIAAYLLNRTIPPQNLAHVAWIHKMDPPTFPVSASEARLAARAVVAPPVDEFESIPLDAYQFVRLFVLSISDPKDISSDAAVAVLKLMTDANEWVAAAAVQTAFIWIQTKEFLIDCDWVFVLAAASVDKTRSPALRALYKAMLHEVGTQHNVAVTILMSEPRMMFEMESLETVVSEKWAFPQFRECLEKLPDLRLIDYQESCRVLGYLVNYLNASDSIENE